MALGPVNTSGSQAAEIAAVRRLAQTASDKATAAKNTADTADSNATAALAAANAAGSAASSAQQTADAAAAAAAAAQQTADDAASAAAAAQQTANTANSTANAAALAAANAQQAADAASQAITDINSTISSVPTQSGTIPYDGSSHTPSWNNYDSDKLDLAVTAQTNAGTYSATFTPKSGYKWGDGSTTGKTANWTIDRATVTLPAQSGTLTYNGNTRTPSWNSNYDSSKMDLSVTGQTNAGTYSATFTPKSNYKWTDGSTTSKTANWTIGKAAGSLSLSPTSLTLNASNTSGTITATRAGNGAVSAVSSNTAIATVSVSGTTVTVTAKAKGSVTITVSVAEGTNHTAPTNKTASVTVDLPTKTLNDNSWATISAVGQAGQGDEWWDVGDAKQITLNGKVGDHLTLSNKTLCVFILGFNHRDNNVNRNGILWGGFKTALTGGVDVALFDAKYSPDASWATYTDGTKCFTMNHKGNSNLGGWKGCDFRYDILGATSTQPANYNGTKASNNAGYDATASTLSSPVANTLLAAFPSDLRAVMVLRTHYVDNVGNKSNTDAGVTAVTDAISLLAEFEIYGTRTYANQYEQNHQAQAQYYANGNAKIRYKPEATTTALYVWDCSPHSNDAYIFCAVYTGGNANATSASYSLALAPAFLT